MPKYGKAARLAPRTIQALRRVQAEKSFIRNVKS
jgi:hypothetical protein